MSEVRSTPSFSASTSAILIPRFEIMSSMVSPFLTGYARYFPFPFTPSSSLGGRVYSSVSIEKKRNGC